MALSKKTKVLLISSVLPKPTSGGELVLHRHLVEQPGLDLDIYGVPLKDGISRLLARVQHRLQRSGRLRRFVADAISLREGRWIDRLLPNRLDSANRMVVVTVAHGTLCYGALRFARRHQLPLVTFFHDWWPDMPCFHEPIRRLVEKRFRNLYRQTQAALCVCKGMQEALGPHPNANVLYPIPSLEDRPMPVGGKMAHSGVFRVVYSGNLWDYGPMLGQALEAARGVAALRIEVRGSIPRWDSAFQEYAREKGLWHDFAPRTELNQWLSEADAFLIPMIFDPAERRRMETSFPSKLLECSQFGKPLVVWGPEYCSAAKWAKSCDAAVCVTDPSPQSIIAELKRLADSQCERTLLAARAKQMAQSEFNPVLIQQQFLNALTSVIAN